MLTRTLAAAGASLLALGALTACASDSTDSAAESPSAAACPIEVADQWVKAADSGMTAGFGVLTNSSDAAVTITAAASPASAMMELHEVVSADGKMVMQPVEGGFEVPANGTLTLEPGGLHIMFMDLPAPIKPGDDVDITLTCGDGGTVAFTAQAKEFAGAEEEYKPGMDHGMSPSPSES